MIKYTNEYGLPAAYKNYLEANPYSKGDADFSITELISPPQIAILRDRHDYTVDVSECLDSIYGTVLHQMLNDNANNDGTSVPEQRFFTELEGVEISGAVDLQTFTNGGVILDDYKHGFIGTQNFDHPDWEWQLNSYAYLFFCDNGYVPDRLRISLAFKDWRKANVAKIRDYPERGHMYIEIPVKNMHDVEEYLRNRIKVHTAADVEPDETLTQCTDSERWHSPDQWAVYEMTKDRKKLKERASRVLDSESEAKAWMVANGKKSATIKHRPGVDRRCESYCEVRDFCHQYRRNNDKG